MQTAHENLTIVVVYYSRFGVLKTLAELIVEGARQVEYVDVQVLEVDDRPLEELLPGETAQDMQRRHAAVVNQLASADGARLDRIGRLGLWITPAPPVENHRSAVHNSLPRWKTSHLLHRPPYRRGRMAWFSPVIIHSSQPVIHTHHNRVSTASQGGHGHFSPDSSALLRRRLAKKKTYSTLGETLSGTFPRRVVSQRGWISRSSLPREASES
jgi:hypothetical protein